MKVSIVGTGYVGLVAAACFADAGHEVACVDSNLQKINSLRNGEIPFYEPGLEELVHRNEKRLQFVETIAAALRDSRVVFVAVGTPELPNGGADMLPTFNVLREICVAAREQMVVVLKSTVPVGTAKLAQEFCDQNSSVPIEIVSNPEFLRQGSAVEDFMKPDRIVIGVKTDAARELMQKLYAPIALGEKPVLVMDNVSAEMTKYAANAFLAIKISFINELALLADKVGADIHLVRDGFASDHRINPAFFSPGIGYGGSCFPKDVRALVATARNVGLELKLLRAADEVNERQKTILSDRLFKRFGQVRGLRVAIWGLAFKPRTDDVRRAPAIGIIEDLVRQGAAVSAYDPVAEENAKSACLAQFNVASSALAAAEGADALLVVTEWPEFKGVDLASLKRVMKKPIVFDGRNLFEPSMMKSLGFEYCGIGRQIAGEMDGQSPADRGHNPLMSEAGRHFL